MTAPSIREALVKCRAHIHAISVTDNAPEYKQLVAEIDAALSAPPQNVVDGAEETPPSGLDAPHNSGERDPSVMPDYLLGGTELRVRARLAWNNWPDSDESRRIIANHEARDKYSADAWDRVIAAILASGLVTAAADNGDLNVADSPLYSKALNALRTAHEACFRSVDRDVLGMSKGPFSGVNLALGIIKNLEEENTLLKATVLRAESAIRADERERCAKIADDRWREWRSSYEDDLDGMDTCNDIAAAIRAGGAK